jgi:hypothetical protein
MNSTDDARTDDARTDEPVSVAEIADFLRQLRGLSAPSQPPPRSGQPARDPVADRAAFLARKADLLARIAAQQPELTPPPAVLPAAPPTARQDGGSA